MTKSDLDLALARATTTIIAWMTGILVAQGALVVALIQYFKQQSAGPHRGRGQADNALSTDSVFCSEGCYRNRGIILNTKSLPSDNLTGRVGSAIANFANVLLKQ